MLKGKALPQLGMDLECDSQASHREEEAAVALCENAAPRKDYFQERDGRRFAGTHLIIDLWGARNLDDLDVVEQALRESVAASGATLLHIHLHHFTPNQGVSGVAVLAESHISIHSWPERGYAALDVFMCGDARPYEAVPILRRAFAPERIEVEEYLRGREEA